MFNFVAFIMSSFAAVRYAEIVVLKSVIFNFKFIEFYKAVFSVLKSEIANFKFMLLCNVLSAFCLLEISVFKFIVLLAIFVFCVWSTKFYVVTKELKTVASSLLLDSAVILEFAVLSPVVSVFIEFV